MATAIDKTSCITCKKGKIVYKCEGCSQYFCLIHLPDHHQELGIQLNAIEDEYNLFRETLGEQAKSPDKHCLVEQINQWENDSIKKIQQTAEETRQLLIKYINENLNDLETKLVKLMSELEHIRIENDFNEIDLNKFKKNLKELQEHLSNPSNIFIEEESSSFINKICVLTADDKTSLDANTTTKENKTPTKSTPIGTDITFQYDNKPSILRSFNSSSSTPIFGSSTPNDSSFGDAPSIKPADNTGNGYTFSGFGNTTATPPSTGFRFPTPSATSKSTSTTTTVTSTTPTPFPCRTTTTSTASTPFSFGTTTTSTASTPSSFGTIIASTTPFPCRTTTTSTASTPSSFGTIIASTTPFSFGTTTTTTSTTPIPSSFGTIIASTTPFSFGTTTTTTSTTPTPSSFGTIIASTTPFPCRTTTTSTASTPFSFGTITASTTPFSFGTTTTTTSTTPTPSSFGTTTNTPLFGNAPKFSFADLAKQPTTNSTEAKVFAGQGSFTFRTTPSDATTGTDSDYECDD